MNVQAFEFTNLKLAISESFSAKLWQEVSNVVTLGTVSLLANGSATTGLCYENNLIAN